MASSKLDIRSTNLEAAINSIDPVTKVIYNKLVLKLDFFSATIEENKSKGKNSVELSAHSLSFGFDPSQKSGFPLVIIPMAEVNIDNVINIIRINVPYTDGTKLRKVKRRNTFSCLYSDIYQSDLHNLLMKTSSITLFLNFKYLSTFLKTFEIFWGKTEFLRKKFYKNKEDTSQTVNESVSPRINNFSTNNTDWNANINARNRSSLNIIKLDSQTENSNFSTLIESRNKSFLINNKHSSKMLYLPINRIKKDNNNQSQSSNANNQSDQKIILSLFDLKIIYLLDYKDEYYNIFKFHSDIREKGYFGYIFRIYSFSLKYKLKGKKLVDTLKCNANMFTVSSLSEENFKDETFFKYDKEIYIKQRTNLKNLEEFALFMELDGENVEGKLINKNILEYVEMREKGVEEISVITSALAFQSSSSNNVNSLNIDTSNFSDLIFDSKHTLIKINGISFKRKYESSENIQSISIFVEDLKITWNMFNKDVLQLLLFDDVLLIVDKIIFRVKQGEKQKMTRLLDLGRLNFNFELQNPQITIQNELKKSTLLLMNHAPCRVVISKFCMSEKSKDFKLEVIYDKLHLYSAPNYMDDSKIYWIGNPKENSYYLEENLFKKVLEAPQIRFSITQAVSSKDDGEFDVYTNMHIQVDKIQADFESAYFTDFLNIIQVFIFDRGYSLAEQKNDIDSKKKDLENYKISELETMLKTHRAVGIKKILHKEIVFSLDRVVLNMAKGGKPMIQLLLTKFEGEHLIYHDKGSDTRMNIKDMQIKNIENNLRNEEILLSPYYYENLGGFEDRISLLTFRKKDNYISIGTDSQWYTLDYFELSLRPLKLNISKLQIEFIVDFFFQPEDKKVNEEDQRNLLMSTSKFREKSGTVSSRKATDDSTSVNSLMVNNKVKPAEKKSANEDYPTYFKQFKINETELLLNFEYAEGSAFNLNNARIKFGHFDKFEKFYPSKTLLDRFVSHCKKQCFKNISSILSSLFGQKNELPKSKEDDEEKHRKLLFGNK